MKAVTWTQVAQYVVLLVACVLAVTWLAGRQSTAPSADAVPPEISVASAVGGADPRELEVARIVAERGAQARRYLADHGNAWRTGRDAREREVAEARGADDLERLQQAERALVDWPGSERAAVARWRREAEADARLGRRAPATARDAASAPAAASASLAAEIGAGVGAVPESNAEVRGHARLNFAALVFCLMVGTAALPHVLMRFYTTASVREARRSAAWTLLFVLLLYLAAPALATLLRQAIHADLVGTAFTSLPTWIPAWQQLDPALLDLKDVNGDGVVQRNEILMGTDTIFLAAPEAATLPYVLSALVAAGGLAAALSTTDGLLLTISNALSHDVYYKVVDPDAPAARRVMISKITLLVIAVLAALVAARRPADVLFLIAAAFSLSAAGFFPALVLGIFWKRATGLGAVAGMLAGLAITVGYMVRNQPWLREVFLGIAPNAPVDGLWWGIQPVAAGLFGVPLGFAVIVLVSLLTPAPSRQTQDLVEQLRSPGWRSPAS